MKQRLPWLVLAAFLVVAASAPFGVRFLTLQTDMDGGNHAITNVSYFAGRIGLTNLLSATNGAFIGCVDGSNWEAVASYPTNITQEQVTNIAAYVSEVRTNVQWSNVTAALALKAPRISPRLDYPIVTNGATFDGAVEIDDVIRFPNFDLSESTENIFQIITAGYESLPLSIFGNLIYADLLYSTNLPRTGVSGLEASLTWLTNNIGAGLGYVPQPAGANLTNWNQLATNVLADFYRASNPDEFITLADLPTYGTAAYSNAAAFYLSSNQSNYVSWATSSNLAFYVSQTATNSQWGAVSNADYDLQVQINALSGGPTGGITAETATNIARAMAKQVTNVVEHGNVQYDQNSTNYVLFWDKSVFRFAECPDLYLDDAGTLYVTGIAGPGSGLTGITSNSIAAATDAVYRQDNVGHYVAAGTNTTAYTNGTVVTVSTSPPGKEVAAGSNVSVVTNGNLVTISSTASGDGYWTSTGSLTTNDCSFVVWSDTISVGELLVFEIEIAATTDDGDAWLHDHKGTVYRGASTTTAKIIHSLDNSYDSTAYMAYDVFASAGACSYVAYGTKSGAAYKWDWKVRVRRLTAP